MIRLALDKVIEAKGITSKEVIEKTGISRNTVKAIIANASTRIDFPTLDALCKGLDVSPADLIKYIPDDEKDRDQ